MECSDCLAPLEEGADICVECGAPVPAAASPRPAQPHAPPRSAVAQRPAPQPAAAPGSSDVNRLSVPAVRILPSGLPLLPKLLKVGRELVFFLRRLAVGIVALLEGDEEERERDHAFSLPGWGRLLIKFHQPRMTGSRPGAVGSRDARGGPSEDGPC